MKGRHSNPPEFLVLTASPLYLTGAGLGRTLARSFSSGHLRNLAHVYTIYSGGEKGGGACNALRKINPPRDNLFSRRAIGRHVREGRRKRETDILHERENWLPITSVIFNGLYRVMGLVGILLARGIKGNGRRAETGLFPSSLCTIHTSAGA